jgi:hypothetical protein
MESISVSTEGGTGVVLMGASNHHVSKIVLGVILSVCGDARALSCATSRKDSISG